MHTLLLLSALFLAVLTPPHISANTEAPPAEAPTGPVPLVEKIEGNTLYFKNENGSPVFPPLKTKLFDLNYFGALEPTGDDTRPYVLISALPCEGCKDQKALYLLRADGSSFNKFIYPGEVRDNKTGGLLLKSRAFYGKCLPNKDDVYIVYQDEKIDRRRYLQTSVYVAQMGPVRIEEKLITRTRDRPSLDRLLKRVKKKECFEIEGIKRKSGNFKIKYSNGEE